MIVGFTGTRHGMTNRQLEKVRNYLARTPMQFAVHGDCVGADSEFHRICVSLNIPVRLYPPTEAGLRAFSERPAIVYPAKPYLERNRMIVDVCDILIACPFDEFERARSGTWSTVRYARSINREIGIYLPSEVQR